MFQSQLSANTLPWTQQLLALSIVVHIHSSLCIAVLKELFLHLVSCEKFGIVQYVGDDGFCKSTRNNLISV